ncbi:outer membrane lipoprotein-sorting protein [Gracilimonas mengyeensis]|uniref:Outer membrane lipoprotein-sorting protein n=1 Tax=Gracilimonas mengyeensis TaxID=1302730 RepID=A0A521BFF8_9BACT|nr:outer membrane lipoprotein-sorting protein [Gracilimonas mengyeensis]SMO45836.1 Outer membrane lipoprotein-sorting protein [Gracilimonas mengyeensis]
MYRLKKLVFLFLMGFVSIPVLGQDATEIIKKMDDKMRGETLEAEITMTIVRPSWERSISMKSWSKGTEFSLILITAPARDEGTAYLKRGNEIWNWVPSVGRTIKMPPSMMMQSWMGSDFTNDDLVRESSVVIDYTHELAGEETVEGYECYKIEMTPKPDAPVVWDRVDVWVTKEEFMQMRTEFFDESGELVNVMQSSNVQTFDGRQIPSKMEMIPQDKEGHKTVLEYESMEFNEKIPDGFFSVQNMRRVE